MSENVRTGRPIEAVGVAQPYGIVRQKKTAFHVTAIAKPVFVFFLLSRN